MVMLQDFSSVKLQKPVEPPKGNQRESIRNKQTTIMTTTTTIKQALELASLGRKFLKKRKNNP